MNTNPYAERRFQEARENFVPLKRNSENWKIYKIYKIGRTRSINASCNDDDERA